MRWIFSFIDFYILSGALAVLIIAVGGKGQRLGDIVAGTSVVKLVRTSPDYIAKRFCARGGTIYSPRSRRWSISNRKGY
jgi:hypothetical protein